MRADRPIYTRTIVTAEYERTHARLANDPEYQRLTEAADREAEHTPRLYLDRNRLALYVEMHMPPL